MHKNLRLVCLWINNSPFAWKHRTKDDLFKKKVWMLDWGRNRSHVHLKSIFYPVLFTKRFTSRWYNSLMTLITDNNFIGMTQIQTWICPRAFLGEFGRTLGKSTHSILIQQLFHKNKKTINSRFTDLKTNNPLKTKHWIWRARGCWEIYLAFHHWACISREYFNQPDSRDIEPRGN